MLFALVLFIPYTFGNIDLTIKFLTNLESSQSINSIFSFYLNNSKYSNEILKSLSLPKINIQNGLFMNYLNLPRFQMMSSLKNYANSEFIAIIFAENIEKNNLGIRLLQDVIWYSRDQIIVIISDSKYTNAVEILFLFRQLNFLNVIFVCVEHFYQSRTFESFPFFKIISNQHFKKENVKNLYKHHLNIICNNNFPLSICKTKNNKIVGNGHFFELMDNFITFLNGTAKYQIEIRKELSDMELLNTVDLWTNLRILPLKTSISFYPLDNEVFSSVLENFKILILLPKSKFIHNFKYILRPFSWPIWALCLTYLVYGTVLLTLSNRIINSYIEFWKIFHQLLRSMLAQSFSSPLPGLRMRIFYLIIMTFGFIITIFYSAFLGSFLTAYIREPQIAKLKELKKTNIKIIYNDELYVNTFGIKDIEDIIIQLPSEETHEALFTMDRRYGHVISNIIWDMSVLPEFYKPLEDFSLEQNFMKMLFPLFSILKKPFNRYIDIVQETGLYNFWKSNFNEKMFETQNESDFAILKIINQKYQNDRRILTIDYFIYPFGLLIVSLIIAIFVFVLEIFKK